MKPRSKNYYSLFACIIVGLVLCQYRVNRSDLNGHRLKVTDWDALGYYMYLPGICIYHDVTELKWFPTINSQYKMSGGNFYQASRHTNDKYVFKYLGGIAILQSPFFAIAHFYAKHAGYPQDGFSPPYQYAIAFAAIIYCLIALFFLRRFLLLFFLDGTVAVTIILLCLATNLIQYVAIDGGMSHAYIIPLYVFVLWTTYLWHKSPKPIWALLTGWLIGVATICRPTEAVMLFIPLMWATQSKETAKAKWQMVKQNKSHIYLAAAGGIAGILPQLIYWKLASGSFIFDVGSAWHFLTPHLRVLTGWEKGWFIYTPVTLFFVAGFFCIKKFPFQKAVLYFCLLNIYIVISWADWHYGGSYSTRALVQSYPVFALPFAAFIEKVNKGKLKWVVYTIGSYLIFVNLFQLKQYGNTILHYHDMNRQYYSHIYLNNNPSPLDMSLMDTDEFLTDTNSYIINSTLQSAAFPVNYSGDSKAIIQEFDLGNNLTAPALPHWVKIEADIKAVNGFYASYLNLSMAFADSAKNTRVRLFNPISKDGQYNTYAFYSEVSPYFYHAVCILYIDGDADFNGEVKNIRVTVFSK